jgi:hypothetical protein
MEMLPMDETNRPTLGFMFAHEFCAQPKMAEALTRCIDNYAYNWADALLKQEEYHQLPEKFLPELVVAALWFLCEYRSPVKRTQIPDVILKATQTAPEAPKVTLTQIRQIHRRHAGLIEALMMTAKMSATLQ